MLGGVPGGWRAGRLSVTEVPRMEASWIRLPSTRLCRRHALPGVHPPGPPEIPGGSHFLRPRRSHPFPQ